MRLTFAVTLATMLAAPSLALSAEQVADPSSGVEFDTEIGDLRLLGTGLRTKTFLKVKVYAIGLYVDPKPLAVHKDETNSSEIYKALVWGDFRREIHMKFIRSSISAKKIRGAFEDSLGAAAPALREKFLGYFGDVKKGDEYVLRWVPGGTLETIVAGQTKPSIADKTFTAAVFAIWLGDKPVQDDIKRGLVSRASEVLK
jgi:hypothetical protein